MSIYKFYEDEIDIQYETKKDTKVCVLCEEEKHISQFHRHNTHKMGRDNRCRVCKNKLTSYVTRLKKTAPPKSDACECCGKKVKLVCDHNHITGNFRGWLCKDCNTSIGSLGDSIEGLTKAINYLKKTEKKAKNGRYFQGYNIFNIGFKKKRTGK